MAGRISIATEKFATIQIRIFADVCRGENKKRSKMKKVIPKGNSLDEAKFG